MAMRWSGCFIPTLKEVPSDAEVVSHRLMLKGGMIQKAASGIYSMLPLGLRSLRKLEAIVREELDRIGCIEIHMPAVQPAELWMESGRWQKYGKELLRIKDRNDRDFCFGPTHEEVVTDIVRHHVKSYRQLPFTLYQIQTKFRDEIRPRFGLMRGREFSMKDAYSFHATPESLDEVYWKIHGAYCRIFERCQLQYTLVEADTGNIGGSQSHEFMVLASTGEDVVFRCAGCGYGANAEKAVSVPAVPTIADEKPKALERVATPGARTVEEVAAFLGVEPRRILKTLLYETDREFAAVLIRGDLEVNEVKLKNALDAQHLALASEAKIEKLTGAPQGFAGPVGLKGVRLLADESVRGMANAVCGANAADAHFVGVNPGRDFELPPFADLRLARDGEPCATCGQPLSQYRGIEVGHIFKLGTKYSEPMKCVFLDEKGAAHPMIMGCYGLGMGRTVAAAIEQNHDDMGIVWPKPLAPYLVDVIATNPDDAAVRAAAEAVYAGLMERGIEAIYDDRGERAGVKFKDAELIGFPLQVVAGSKKVKEGKVELADRRSGEKSDVEVARAVEAVADRLR
jgi:prolyl-tRNA synthetase